MKNSISILVVASGFLLSACASNTGVVPLGQDTYMVGTSGHGTGSKVKANALIEARKFCEGLGKSMQIINTQQADERFDAIASAEVQFMCLSAGDMELGRPRLQRTPNQVIEVVSPNGTPSGVITPQKRDLYSEMLKLEELKKRGLLSDAEFEDQRRRLLRPE